MDPIYNIALYMHAACMHVCSRKMISAAWTWASSTSNLRKNPIHGEEEARLILNDKFEAADVTGQDTDLTGRMDIEDSLLHYI